MTNNAATETTVAATAAVAPKAPAKKKSAPAAAKKTAAAAKKPVAAKAPPTTIRGTIAELVNSITVNGRTVDQPTLSALTRMGFGKEVGTAERPAGTRGPAPKVWEFAQNIRLSVARR